MYRTYFFLITLSIVAYCASSQRLPENCADAVRYRKRSGVYQIQIRPPKGKPKAIYVYCELDNKYGEDAWTIIQRRQDGSVDFLRDWKDYKKGFGNINGEYWIGLDNLHALTHSAGVQELWIELMDFNKTTVYAEYDAFAIGSEEEDYVLNVLGRCRGNAGDSLRFHEGMKFSTRDNSHSPGRNWASLYTGAWWFNNGFHSHLNGQYLRGTPGRDHQKGITWLTFRALWYSLKYSHMAIRTRK